MFGAKHKIKLDPDLFARCKQHAETAGYSSVEEFVHHAIETALKRAAPPPADQEKAKILERLKGLGYVE